MKPLHSALVTLCSIYLIGCSGFNDSGSGYEGVFTSEIQKFSSCSDMRATISIANAALSQIYPIFEDAVPVMMPTTGTNEIYDSQSASVLESDKVLINSRNLFILRKDSLEVFNRATFQRSSIVTLSPAIRNTMFVDDKNLILIATNNYETTDVTVFDSNQLTVKKQYKVDGNFSEARLHNQQLIVQTTSYANLESTTEGNLNSNAKVLSPQCQDIYESQVSAYSNTLTLLYNFSLDNLSEAPAMTGLAGYTSLMYMSENALYLATNSFYKLPSHLRQVVWDKDSIQLKSVVTYSGEVKDRWALNEYKDSNGITLAVATTISSSNISSNDAVTTLLPNTDRTNQILMFKEVNGKLSVATSSKTFGHNENIRSVRYLNDLAYVVTFRTTDPLFIFDLSNRSNIQQVGELKVPGFSTHLRPLADSHLLGVGYDADVDHNGNARQTGIQVSLFDVSRKEKPIRKNAFTIGVRGSYSDATIDAHALMYDKNPGLVALPVVEMLNPNNDAFSFGTSVGFAGAHVYKYQQGQLQTYGRLSHNKWRQHFQCDSVLFNGWSFGSSDINRIIMVDGNLVTVSQFGVMVHNPQTLGVTSEQMFTPRSSGFCYEPGFAW